MLMSRCIGNDIEVYIGELDTLKEPSERRGIGHIGGLRLTTTTSKHATDTTATDFRDCY